MNGDLDDDRTGTSGNPQALYEAASLAEDAEHSAASRPLFEQAAALGSGAAMCTLGNMAAQEEDLAAAIAWWERAAAVGDTDAMYNLGLLARDEGDREAARQWLQRAANAGDTDASYLLAEMSREDGDWRAGERHMDDMRRGLSVESFAQGAVETAVELTNQLADPALMALPGRERRLLAESAWDAVERITRHGSVTDVLRWQERQHEARVRLIEALATAGFPELAKDQASSVTARSYAEEGLRALGRGLAAGGNYAFDWPGIVDVPFMTGDGEATSPHVVATVTWSVHRRVGAEEGLHFRRALETGWAAALEEALSAAEGCEDPDLRVAALVGILTTLGEELAAGRGAFAARAAVRVAGAARDAIDLLPYDQDCLVAQMKVALALLVPQLAATPDLQAEMVQVASEATDAAIDLARRSESLPEYARWDADDLAAAWIERRDFTRVIAITDTLTDEWLRPAIVRALAEAGYFDSSDHSGPRPQWLADPRTEDERLRATLRSFDAIGDLPGAWELALQIREREVRLAAQTQIVSALVDAGRVDDAMEKAVAAFEGHRTAGGSALISAPGSVELWKIVALVALAGRRGLAASVLPAIRAEAAKRRGYDDDYDGDYDD